MSEATDAATALRQRIEQITTGYGLSAVLFAAGELRLFDHLAAGPAHPAALAARIGASTTGVARLCTALAAIDLLERGADGRFSAAAGVIDLLGDTGPGSLLPVVLHHQRHLAPLMACLPDAIRHARPQHHAWSFASPDAGARHCYEELARHPSEYALFLRAMDESSARVGDDIARAFDLGTTRRLIDLGGGSGRVARELLAATPSLRIDMIDLPDACQTALLRAREAGVGARLRVIPGDFTRPLDEVSIEPADVVLLSGILADWSVDDCAQILANAARSLRPGGRLLVSETLLDDARTGPTLPALLSLLMLAAMPGDSFTLPELTELLGRADFAVIAHHAPSAPGRRDLIIAQRHRAKGTSPDQKTLSRDRL